MAALIDRQALLERIEKTVCKYCDDYGSAKCGACALDGAIFIIDAQNAVEPKKGEWVKVLVPIGESVFGIDEGTAEAVWCSLCKKDYWAVDAPMNFCPNCGADMRGESDA